MVLTLAMSRGIPNVQGDMDDPTAKLTSNFGHCSQELINLLLTGQAGELCLFVSVCVDDMMAYCRFVGYTTDRNDFSR
jgi:hypothetical protein